MRLLKIIAALAVLAVASPALAAPAPQIVNTAEILQAGNFTSYGTVIVNGSAAVGDGGAGTFSWILGACTPDGGTLLASAGVSPTVGCWHRYIVNQIITPEMFYHTADGSDWRPAFERAMAYEVTNTGSCLNLAPKIYHISGNTTFSPATGINVPNKGCMIGSGANSSILVPTTNTMTAVRLSGSQARVEHIGIKNTNTVTGSSCIRMSSSDESTTATIDNNIVNDIGCTGFTEGLVMILTGGGFEYFNQISNILFTDNVRSVWLKSTGTNGGPNNNEFHNLSFVNATSVQNTGIQIDAGAYNNWHNIACEGAAFGTSPNGTPTCLIIVQTGGGIENDGNRFYGLFPEGNTRDINLANQYTEFYGWTPAPSKVLFTKAPGVSISGNSGTAPMVFPGFAFESNSELTLYNNLTSIFTGANGSCTTPDGGLTPITCDTVGGRQMFPATAVTSAGGGTVNIGLTWPYSLHGRYTAYVGCYDQAGTAAYYDSILNIVETASGTFPTPTVIGTDFTDGGVAGWSVGVTRTGSAMNFAVNLTKAATTFVCYVSMERMQ